MLTSSSVCLGGLVLAAQALCGVALAAPDQSGQPEPPAPYGVGVYVHANAQAWANGLPVLDFDGAWAKGYERDLGREHRAYQSTMFESGVTITAKGTATDAATSPGWWQPKVFRLGLVQRSEAFVSMSGQAAELAYLYQSQLDPSQPTTLDAQSKALAWRGRGLSVHLPVLHLPASSMQLGLQWLQVQRLRRSSTQGAVAYEPTQGYAYDLNLSDDNSRTRAPFFTPPASQGQAMSMSWRWQGHAPGTPWSWRLRLDDVWSRLRWSDIHRETAFLTSNVRTRDAQGYINIRPALTGQYVRQEVTERIPMAVDAQATYQSGSQAPQDAWSLRLHHRWGMEQAWLGWQRNSGQLQWSAAIEPRLGALDMGVSWAGLDVGVMLDALSQAAQVRAVSIRYQWP